MQYSNTTNDLPLDQILCGDNLELIRQLPDRSVQLVITSPPYFQQRDYGAGMGNEARLEEYLENLLSLFRECVRVVKDDGSLVFNLGDKYEDRQPTPCAVPFCNRSDGNRISETGQRCDMGEEKSNTTPI